MLHSLRDHFVTYILLSEVVYDMNYNRNVLIFFAVSAISIGEPYGIIHGSFFFG